MFPWYGRDVKPLLKPIKLCRAVYLQTRVDDFRHQDQFNNLSQSVSQINVSTDMNHDTSGHTFTAKSKFSILLCYIGLQGRHMVIRQ